MHYAALTISLRANLRPHCRCTISCSTSLSQSPFLMSPTVKRLQLLKVSKVCPRKRDESKGERSKDESKGVREAKERGEKKGSLVTVGRKVVRGGLRVKAH